MAIHELDLFLGQDPQDNNQAHFLLNEWDLVVTVKDDPSESGEPELHTAVGPFVGVERIESFCRMSTGIFRSYPELMILPKSE